MIELKSVTKKFGDFTAVENLSFKVDKASVYGLVGYNGAGKTTVLKTVAGVYRPDGGEVLIDGENVFDSARQKAKIFYVPDDLYFEPYASLYDMAKFYSGYYKDFSFETFDKLINVFGLDKKARINSFSKGMQRQGELVLGMSTNPKILLLDESFDGLDPSKRNLMNNMVMEYMAERECSVIVSSHNLHELAGICDRIALIGGKKLVMDCNVDDISASRAKFRVVFEDEKTQADFIAINHKNFKKDGKIITFVVEGNFDEAEHKLNAMKPLLVEKYPLSLEEIFLAEMEGSDYDFKEIFG